MVGQSGTEFRAFDLFKQVHLVLAQMVIVRWAEQSSLLLVSKHGAVRPQKPYGLLGTGRKGYGGGGRGRLYTYRYIHCHHQNDSCFKIDSDESHFNVSAGGDGQCPQTTTFLKRKKSRSGIEPRSFRLPA